MSDPSNKGNNPDQDSLDLSSWEPQIPPAGFADRVLDRIAQEATPPARPLATEEPRALGSPEAGRGPGELRAIRPPPAAPRGQSRLARGLGALLLAAAFVACFAWLRARPADHGEAEALDRREVALGSRALAVLEPGARVRWEGAEVTQTRGDVFYRVEPGGRFRVHTPAGDVEVKGTCFTLKIRGSEPEKENEMDGRDLKVGAVSAALSALVLVSVHEGRVALARGSDRMELRAGEGALAGPGGLRRVDSTREGERRLEQASAGAEDAQLAQTNQNLAAQVEVYRSRLEALATQRNELEKKLQTTEEKLAVKATGSPPRTHSEYDPTPEEWAELAKKGTVKYRTPCLEPDRWVRAITPERLTKLGLAPDDAAPLKGAYERSSQRLWSQIKPLCATVLGSPGEVIDKIGPDACSRLIYDLSMKSDREAATEAHTQAAEIRAGLRPEPAAQDPQHPVLKLFLLMTGAQGAFESDLAASLGPEEAHRIANSEGLCSSQSTISGGKERGSKSP